MFIPASPPVGVVVDSSPFRATPSGLTFDRRGPELEVSTMSKVIAAIDNSAAAHPVLAASARAWHLSSAASVEAVHVREADGR